MVADLSAPLPLEEREGPAAVRRWEGEGTWAAFIGRPSSLLALTHPRFAWAPPSPQRGEGL
jgi:hypothetical protein